MDKAEIAEKTISLKAAKMKATEFKYQLEPLCEVVRVAGSVRRNEARVHDIDFVCIPKFKPVRDPESLFPPHKMVNRVIAWLNEPGNDEFYQVKGGPRMQKIIFQHLPVKIYMTTLQQFGRMLAIRTGPENYTKKMAARWVQLGYHGVKGELVNEHDPTDKPEFKTEKDFFSWLCWEFVKPEARL